MSILYANLPPSVRARTERGAPRFHLVKPGERDSLHRMAGDMYAHSLAPMTPTELACVLGVGKTTAWRLTSGTEPTALSRLGEEHLAFSRLGLPTAHYGAFVALLDFAATVERMGLQEVSRALRQAHVDETEAQARLDPLQARDLDGQPVCSRMLCRHAMAHYRALQWVAVLANRRAQLVGA